MMKLKKIINVIANAIVFPIVFFDAFPRFMADPDASVKDYIKAYFKSS